MDKTFDLQYEELHGALGHHTGYLSQKLERLRSQLAFARQLSVVNRENTAVWSASILEAGRRVDEGLRQPGADIDVLIAEAETILAPLKSTAKSYKLLCVGHAHIDMNWQWSWP